MLSLGENHLTGHRCSHVTQSQRELHIRQARLVPRKTFEASSMKKSILLATCFVAALSCTSLYAQASSGDGPKLAGDTIPQADRMFVSQAGAANMAEVALGNLAVRQGQSDAVKNFGNRMIADHTAANVALNNLAGPLGLALAQQPTMLQEKTIDSLA